MYKIAVVSAYLACIGQASLVQASSVDEPWHTGDRQGSSSMEALAMVLLASDPSAAFSPANLGVHTRAASSRLRDLSSQPSSVFATSATRRASLRPARVAAVQLAEEGEAEAEKEEPEAKGEAEANATDTTAEKEEEEDELLTSIPFLKRKLGVLEKEIEDSAKETAEILEQAAEINEKWAFQRERLSKDFENFRARKYAEEERALVKGKADAVKGILPILDDLDRTFENMPTTVKGKGEEAEALNAKYEDMQKQMRAGLFDRLGLVRMPGVGSEFNMSYHEAVEEDYSADFGKGIVMDEYMPAYTMGGQLVRVGYVVVNSR
mmetsp:Transcript_1521/g.2610  ORF Transcript_1521/g.2610 Transcript_1521/m.2610 type:complete len:322 (-) Transcript_1521:183-1148(-)